MSIRRLRRRPTPVAVPICQRCNLAVFPPGSYGESMGNGCACRQPRPTTPLFPIVRRADAEQLALFTPADVRRSLLTTDAPAAAIADEGADSREFPRLAQ